MPALEKLPLLVSDIHTSVAGHDTAISLLLISTVASLGLALGSVKVKGISLGSAGVLFAALIIGSMGFQLDPAVADFLKEFGLMLFVFTMGLQLGPGFFASLRKSGVKLNLLAVSIVIGGFLCTWAGGALLHVQPGARLGVFSGATTNTPSLGAAQQALDALASAGKDQKALVALAYSASYPVGIFGIIATLLILKAVFKIDIDAENKAFDESQRRGIEPLTRLNVVVENANLDGVAIRHLPGRKETAVMISRIRKRYLPEVATASEDTEIHVGDHLLIVGTTNNVETFQRIVGSRSDLDLMKSPGAITFRRVVVTNKAIWGKTFEEIGIDHIYDVAVTRVVRAGVEMTAVPDLRLQFGDFLHVVGDAKALDQASEFLGNSLQMLNRTPFIPVFVGLAIGVLVGMVPIAVPGLSSPLRFGLAGGPLVVAIFLSRIGRLGPLVWHMPPNTNLAFRELGIALFLTCVGLTAGPKFLATMLNGSGLKWALSAAAVTIFPLAAAGILGRLWLKLNFLTLCGVLAGSMTDPPALAFANALAKSEAPSLGYATVYPLTMLCRILIAQVMAILFFW